MSSGTGEDADAEPTGEAKKDGTDGFAYLNDWPYTSFHLQSTLDPKLIERHGEAILSRALNLGRVVAFVGSGVSMSYGRLSWKSLVQALAEDAHRDHDREESAWADRAKKTLDDLDIKGRSLGGDLQSGRYPAAFQFCEQLSIAGERKNGQKEFRKKVKRLLFHDAGHAKVLIDDLIRDCAEISCVAKNTDAEKTKIAKTRDFYKEKSDTWLEKLHDSLSIKALYGKINEDEKTDWRYFFAIHKLRGDEKHSPEGELFNSDGILRLSDDFGNDISRDEIAKGIVRDLALNLGDAVCCTKDNTGLGRLPLHRYLVTAVARLSIPAIDKLEQVLPSGDRLWKLFDETRSFFNPDPAPDRSILERTDFVPPERDPLAILADRLKIGRFITSNFDLDIERLIRDRGFTPDGRDTDDTALPTSNETISPLGATATDSVFKTKKATDLIDFAINDATNTFTLMHLHGRATETDGMVVTERDYLELYLPRGPDGEVVNDALEIGFGSNPLLFVGNGMGEDDILRPLRQFVSERTSGSDRQVIALLPALGSPAQEIEETIAIYSRYGAYTVHFGHADVGTGTGTAKTKSVRWLAHTLALTSDLKDVFTALDQCLSGSADAYRLLNKLKKLNKKLHSSSDDDWNVLIEKADRDKCNKISINLKQINIIENIFYINGDSQDHIEARLLHPTLEMEVLKAALSAAMRLFERNVGEQSRDVNAIASSIKLVPELEFAIKSLPKDRSGEADPQYELVLGVSEDDRNAQHRRAWRRVALAYVAALDGLPDALIGLSLCAKLLSIEAGWVRWKRDWHALPIPRLTGGPFQELLLRGKNVPFCGRHPLALPVLASPDPGAPAGSLPGNHGDRFFAGAPSQMFGSFLSALRYARDQPDSALKRPWANQRPEVFTHDKTHNKAGRRIFILLAKRGAGRGDFFENLRSSEQVERFIEVSWPKDKNLPPYAAVVALNLRFSAEFTSAFDRLANILVYSAPEVFGELKDSPATRAIVAAGRDLEKNRLGKLTRLFELYSEHHVHARARILIAINAVEVLFNSDGQPKTGQASRLVEAVLSKRADHAPIDLMLVGVTGGVPIMFRKDRPGHRYEQASGALCTVAPIPLEHLVREKVDEEGRRKLAKVVQQHEIRDESGWTTTGDLRWRPTSPGSPTAFVHLLHETRASLVIGTFFPRVALALAANPGRLSRDAAGAPERSVPDLDHDRQRELSKAIAAELAGKPYLAKNACLMVRKTMLLILDRAEEKKINQRIPKDILNECIRERTFNEIAREIARQPADQPPSDPRLSSLDADFKTVFGLCGGYRLVLSIACAAADEAAGKPGSGAFAADRIVRWFSDALGHMHGAPLPARPELMIGYVLQFYATRHDSKMPLPDACKIVPTLAQRMTKANKACLGGKFTKAETIVEDLARELEKRLESPDGWRLQQVILWHLGVTGNPLTADVLAAAPKIRELCRNIVNEADKEKAHTDERKRSRCCVVLVQAALDILVHRCLIFRLQEGLTDSKDVPGRSDTPVRPDAPSDGEENKPPVPEPLWRFTLHRLLQRSIYQRLHAPAVEFTAVDQYTLSLYGTLPNDLPKPRAEAVRDLDALIADWTGFPKDSEAITTPSSYHDADRARMVAETVAEAAKAEDAAKTAAAAAKAVAVDAENAAAAKKAAVAAPAEKAAAAVETAQKDREVEAARKEAAEAAAEKVAIQSAQGLPSRMLRAAFGVVRSVYSVGVVSRFDDFGDWNGPRCGYFEEHRLQIRWLLKKAVGLSYEDPKTTRVFEGAEFEHDHPGTPFFAEEIVWLYNECGLLSLIEGRLNDALALFGRALAAAERIEPGSEHGPLRSRLMLNKSIVDMERGRVSSARSQLEIVAARPNEHHVIGAVANGYIGVCAHIAGDFETAQAKYRSSIKSLRASGHSRGVAIFSRHLADLYRAWSPDFQGQAFRAVEQAISHAEKGGHEDIRQIARLARVRLEINRSSTSPQRDGVQSELDDLERYAEVMGLPRLLCEVLYVRASFLLQIGETRHAASLARRCLQQATMNDLKLRQVSTLGLLASIYQKRGLHDAAKPLFDRARMFATLCNYRNTRFATNLRGD
ncbi:MULTISPECIES: SIR2 family protein [Methylobacterium]|uniref:SIR2 family protein n=1 Tax=Methylobacterium TaxID=407 RepID=UPI0013EBCE02|nr:MULTISPECIES: SIR2 family protein [unclassified Methylobacterium]NGM37991.1 hypothetical protein [Methylobacterium sp. DB0501]